MRNELYKRNTLLIVLSLIIIVIGIVFSVLVEAVFTRDKLFASEKIALQLDDAMQNIKINVKPVTDSLGFVKSWSLSGVLQSDDGESFFKILVPVFEQNKQITGFSFSNSQGRFYELTRREGFWESLQIEHDQLTNKKIYSWIRFDSVGNVLDRWQGMLPEILPEDLSLPDSNLSDSERDFYWEIPKRATESSGNIISCVTQWQMENVVYKASVEFQLGDIFGKFSDIYQSSYMRVFMLRADGNIVGLFNGINVSGDEEYNAEKSVIADWKSKGREKQTNSSFYRIADKGILYMIRSFASHEKMDNQPVVDGATKPLSASNAYMGVIFFEDDILKQANAQARMFFILPASVVVLGIVMLITVVCFARRDKHLSENMFELPSDEQGWIQLIAKGEGKYLEFKSALRWNLTKECKDLKIEEAIMKAVAAFGNSEGGILLIGINDDGLVVGLNNDYATLKTPDKDSFELHMRNLLNSEYGVEFTAKNIYMEFPVLDDKEFCVVVITQSDKPLYVKMTDLKNGGKVEKFYVRSGNSSREIVQLSEIAKFTEGRFKKQK